jgi:transposase
MDTSRVSQMTQAVLGIDVGKSKLHVCLLLPSGKSRAKSIDNTSYGHTELLDWLQQQQAGTVHACMESTGIYGNEVAEVLYAHGHTVSIVNPARVKGFATSEMVRTKTDKVDAGVIARFCAALKPTPWQPSAPQMKQLQALVRRLEALQQMHRQESNRLEAASAEAVRASIQTLVTHLETDMETIRQAIRDHIDQHPDLKQQQDLLMSIPGIAETTATAILAEIQSWQMFENARQLAAFVGLTPRERLSGTSVRGRPQISRTGSNRLRKTLYFPALVAKRHNPLIKAFCARLEGRGKRKMQIVAAAMRKLVHLVYGVLKSGKPFDPEYAKAGT